MMRKLLIVLFSVLLLAGQAHSLELVRQKNVATYIVFPLLDSDGNYEDGEASGANADSEIDVWADGSAPDGFADCTNEIAEIGTTGIYSLSLSQAEMNNDYIVIRVSTDNSIGTVILIRTMVGDPLNVATTDDGGAINVASGVAEANAVQVSGDATAADTLELFAEALDQATGQIDSGTLHDDTITAASINTGAFTADAFAADALVAATFATGAFTADAFAADALVAATFATNCITDDAIADGTITAAKLGADCITEAKIADDAIGDEHIDASFMGTDGKVLISTDAQDLSATMDVNTKTLTAGAITATAIATDAVDADALAANAVDEIMDEVVESTWTFRKMFRVVFAVLAGKSSGGGTGTRVYRDIGDTTDRVTATVESDGDRTAISLDGD